MFIGILFIILLISVFFNVIFVKSIQKKNHIIAQKNATIERASQNMKHLVDYQDIIQNIEKDHKEVYNQIKEASTDEEVNNIIRNLIDINNKHVQNDWKRVYYIQICSPSFSETWGVSVTG